METITMKNLEGAVNRLNGMVGLSDIEKLKRGTVGMYVLDGAYGGWKLAQLVNAQGGETNVSTGGYVSKRELWNQIQTVIKVLELQRVAV